MNAEGIRASELVANLDYDRVNWVAEQAAWLKEIATQLAELNQKLATQMEMQKSNWEEFRDGRAV